MNSSIYFFGNMQNGYTQYPDDGTTREIFEHFATNFSKPTQLAIHRDGSLMYYGYMRRLQGEEYIGMCVMLNSRMFINIAQVFWLFEKAIDKLAKRGYLIKFNINNGSLVSNTQHLYMSKGEVDTISEWLQRAINELETYTSLVPATDYSIASNASKVFSHTDSSTKIVEASYTYSYTFVRKSDNFNTANLDSYQGIISSQAKLIKDLKDEIERLRRNDNQQRNTSNTYTVPTPNKVEDQGFTNAIIAVSLLIISFILIMIRMYN